MCRRQKGNTMYCKFFMPNDYCFLSCNESLCTLKGGSTDPSEMCGCDSCALQHIVGDKEECLAEKGIY